MLSNALDYAALVARMPLAPFSDTDPRVICTVRKAETYNLRVIRTQEAHYTARYIEFIA